MTALRACYSASPLAAPVADLFVDAIPAAGRRRRQATTTDLFCQFNFFLASFPSTRTIKYSWSEIFLGSWKRLKVHEKRSQSASWLVEFYTPRAAPRSQTKMFFKNNLVLDAWLRSKKTYFSFPFSRCLYSQLGDSHCVVTNTLCFCSNFLPSATDCELFCLCIELRFITSAR